MNQRNETMETTIDGIAHEFNNFLTGIQNYVNLAKLCTTNRQVVKYLDNTLSIVDSAQMFTKFIKSSEKANESKCECVLDISDKNGECSDHESTVPDSIVESSDYRRRILLMDDEQYIRFATSELLTRKQYAVTTASDGVEAIDLYKKALNNNKTFDLVILDLTVSQGMGGVETLKHLLEIDPGVKAVASSGYSDDAVMARPQHHGFTAALKKPYRLNEFLDLIHNVLNG